LTKLFELHELYSVTWDDHEWLGGKDLEEGGRGSFKRYSADA